jgi:cellulose synthase/poly-beta-1,6-N-acetylglucosamine synthase-like glycosyltransferase
LVAAGPVDATPAPLTRIETAAGPAEDILLSVIERPAPLELAPVPGFPLARVKTGAVAVVIPARNEAEQIAATVEALLAQTTRPDRIVIVVNNCTDDGATAASARAFPEADVVEMTDNLFLKAGALNRGIEILMQGDSLPEFVLTMDADTIPDPDFIENTTAVLRNRPEVGAVSTVCDGKKNLGKKGSERALAVVQQLEYARAGFTRIRKNIHTMTGAGSMIRTQAVIDVLTTRGVLFDERSDNLVEDFEATLEIKRLGWKVVNNYYCHVQTDLMLTVPDLMKQRTRWVQGTIDELRRHGWHKESRLSILTMWYAVLSIPVFYLWITLGAFHIAVGNAVPAHFWFLALVVVFQAISVYRLGWRMMLLAAVMIPEMLYAVLRHTWIVASLVKSFVGRGVRRPHAPTEQAW